MSDTSALSSTDSPSGGDVAAWLSFEERYLQGRYAGADGIDTVRYVPALASGPASRPASGPGAGPGSGLAPGRAGLRPVLFTAPHAVTHWRDGQRKPVDMATGGLAEALAARTGAAALTVTGRPLRDPNHDPDGTFKDQLAQVLPRHCAVLDLHGMNDSWGPDICLALGAHPDLAADLRAVLEPALTAAGFTVAVNHPYQAAPAHTVTSTVQAAGTSAIELELARRVRRPWDQPERAQRLMTALTDATTEIARRLGTAPA